LKKPFVALVALALVSGLVSSLPASARAQRPRIVSGRGTAAPSFVTGIVEAARSGSAVDAAIAHLRSNVSRYGIAAPERSLRVDEVIEHGSTATVRFAQRYQGLPVFGAQYLVHLRRQDGGYRTQSVNGHYFTELNVNVKPRFSAAAARELVVRRMRHIAVDEVENHGRTVLAGGRGTPAFHFTLRGTSIGRVPVRQEVFVNVRTGAIALTYNNMQFQVPVVGTGVNSHGGTVPLNIFQRDAATYEARDQSRPMFASDGGEIITHNAQGEDGSVFVPTDATVATDPDTNFDGANTDSGVVDAHWGAGRVYEYFLGLGRNSIDDQGMSIISVANAGDLGGGPLYNASWDGEKMTYGNPDPSQLHPFSADLDVVAHELTHGVTEFSGGLVYISQSGAMNEAYSDYFGNAVDVIASGTPMNSPDAGFIGEDLCRVPDPDGWECPLRDMNDGRTTEDFIFYLADFDGGGVHLNSTIYAGTLWDIREQLNPATADELVYRALTEFTTPLDNFSDGRNSVVAAAQALGLSPAEMGVINGAFDAKGIVDGWDSIGGSDADILIENFSPLGFFFSPPQVSGSRYVVGHYEDLLDLCCAPEQILVGNVNGQGGLTNVGQNDDPATLNDELPDISGRTAVWSHLTAGPDGLDFDVNGRTLGGDLRRIGRGPGLQWFPAIHGNTVAWEDTRSGDTDIRARVGNKKPVKVTTKPGEEFEPDVHGNWVTWLDIPDTSPRPAIGLKNLKTGKSVKIVRPGNAMVGNPSISGKYVYWYEDADFFTNKPGSGFGTIMRAKHNGKNVKALFKASNPNAPVWFGVTPATPTVSGNNSWVAYDEESGYVADVLDPNYPAALVGRNVFIVPSGGGGPKLLTCNAGDQAFPAIGNNKRVLFMDSSQARTDLVTRTDDAAPCP
jgi:beta propeller repeat protein